MMARLLWAVLLMAAAWPLTAQAWLQVEEPGAYKLGTHFQWTRDKGQELSIKDVLGDQSLIWVHGEQAVPNLGYTEEAVWFRVALNNRSEIQNWYLAIDYPLIRSLDVYHLQDGKVVKAMASGDRFEFSARPIQHRNFVFPLLIEKDVLTELYIRVAGPYSIQMPAELLVESAFIEKDAKASLLHGLFFGFVLVMACYNFFLFVATKESAYLFYVLFTLSIGGFQFVQQGFAFQFLWPKDVWLQNKGTGAFIHLSLISSFLFMNSFLGLRQNLVVLFRVLVVLTAACLVMLLSMAWLDEFWTMRVGVVLALPGSLLAIVGGWIMWKKGRDDAHVFSIAWGVFLLGVLLLSLNKLGFIPRNFVTEHGAEVGTIIELALLAFALANRINQERDKRLSMEKHARDMERRALVSKERALELEKLNSEQLEHSVRERTRDLHKALSDLSIMNRRLEAMNQVDSVTGLGNENCFLSTLEKEWERSYRRGEPLSLIVVELDNYRDIVVNYGAVAADESLKNVAAILTHLVSRPSDVLTRYGEKVFGIILPATEEKGALFLAEKIVAMVAKEPFCFGVAKLNGSVSVGLASVMPQSQNQFKGLIELAESAVYVARNNGGNGLQAASLANVVS